MRRVTWMTLAVLGLVAYSGGGGGFTGKWDSTFGGVSLEIKADHTVAITTVGMPSEGTWEPRDKNGIVVHGPKDELVLTKDKEGGLSAGMMGHFVRHKD
jgi:hypothetical protein